VPTVRWERGLSSTLLYLWQQISIRGEKNGHYISAIYFSDNSGNLCWYHLDYE